MDEQPKQPQEEQRAVAAAEAEKNCEVVKIQQDARLQMQE